MSVYLLRTDKDGYVIGGREAPDGSGSGFGVPGIAALEPDFVIAWPNGETWTHEDHHVAQAPRTTTTQRTAEEGAESGILAREVPETFTIGGPAAYSWNGREPAEPER